MAGTALSWTPGAFPSSRFLSVPNDQGYGWLRALLRCYFRDHLDCCPPSTTIQQTLSSKTTTHPESGYWIQQMGCSGEILNRTTRLLGRVLVRTGLHDRLQKPGGETFQPNSFFQHSGGHRRERSGYSQVAVEKFRPRGHHLDDSFPALAGLQDLDVG